MRTVGRALAWVGLALGVVTGLSIFLPVHLTGLSWIVGVGVVKLAFASSLALMGIGAGLQRAALQRGARDRQLKP